MRLFWKLFCSMIAITALACSAGGYLLIDSQFQAALDSRAEPVVMENSLLRHSLMREMQLAKTFDQAGAARLADSVTASVGVDGTAFRLTDEAGQQLAGSRLPAESHLLQALGEKQSGWEVLPAGDSLYLHAASPLRLTDGLVYLETWRDVDDVFQARQAQYHVFFYLMLFLILAVGLLALAVSAWLSRPLKRLSEATKKVATGELSERVQVSSDDEIGQLSADFNIMAEQMERQVRELTDAARRQEDFLHSFAHETKTPLTSIIGYIDLLKKTELSDEARDYVDILSQKSERLKYMIQEVFEISKATSGNMDLHIEMVDICTLIRQTMGDMEERIIASNRVIRKQLSEEPLYVLTDGQKIYRVYQNLIENALKYSLEGSRIFIDAFGDGNNVTTIIKNTSSYEMNFTEETITERFTRGDASRTTEGHGLGLAIVKSFAEACGGTFHIHIDGDMFKAIVVFKRTFPEKNEVALVPEKIYDK